MKIEITKEQLDRIKTACETYGLDPMITKKELQTFVDERIDEFTSESEAISR